MLLSHCIHPYNTRNSEFHLHYSTHKTQCIFNSLVIVCTAGTVMSPLEIHVSNDYELNTIRRGKARVECAAQDRYLTAKAANCTHIPSLPLIEVFRKTSHKSSIRDRRLQYPVFNFRRVASRDYKAGILSAKQIE